MSWTYWDTFMTANKDERLEMLDNLKEWICFVCGGDLKDNDLDNARRCDCQEKRRIAHLA